jgi:tellurite resistance protein TehA-like permease
MFLFYFSITLAILSSALYHFSAKSMPSNINFAISLVVTYSVALGITLITMFLFSSEDGIVFELKQVNWSSFLLAVAIVGIEFGFLLTYRAGWLGNGNCRCTGQCDCFVDPCSRGDFYF